MTTSLTNIAASRTSERNPMRTLKDTNYFGKGTLKREYLQTLLEGGVANFLTKTLLAPLERFQIIMQTQAATLADQAPIKNFSAYLKTRETLGWRSFWRGNQANCWLTFWQLTFQVALFDSLRDLFSLDYFYFRQYISLDFSQHFLEPLITSMISLIVLHPVDTARIRLAMNPHPVAANALFEGIPSCLSMIRLENRSPLAIYRGYILSNLICVIHLNLYLTCSVAIDWIMSSDKTLVLPVSDQQWFLSALGVLALHPLDSLKKRIQYNNLDQPTVYPNVRSLLLQLYKNSQFLGLYKGITASCLRTILYTPIFALALQLTRKNSPLQLSD